MALDREQILARLAEEEGQRDLSGLDMSGADLSRLDLRGVKLSRADLSSADLRWAILDGADLHSSVLRRADARWAIFRGANLRQADLTRANMGWSDITGADLTGAEMDGTNLENVDLGDGVVERRVTPRQWAIGGVPSEIKMPKAGLLPLAAAALLFVLLIQAWGWLFNRTYFGAFEILDQPGIVSLSSTSNLTAGLGEVVVLMLKALILSPLFLIAFGVIVGLVVAFTYSLVYVGERLLERADVTHPRARPALIAAIFVVYTVIFWLAVPHATAWARDQWQSGLPDEGGAVRAIYDLFIVGGAPVKIGMLALVGVAGVLLWLGWRWLSIRLVDYELPAELRLRYPSLNSALAEARVSPAFERNEPLSDQERRRAIYAGIGGLLLLGTVLSGVGKVYALYDMCDGGDLPRVVLYANRLPDTVPDDSEVCQREIAVNETDYFVFFPVETTQSDGLASRTAMVSAVPADRVVKAHYASSDSANCLTCGEAPSGKERVVVDPDEIQVTGVIQERSGDLLLLDVDADEPYGTVRLFSGDTIVRDTDRTIVEDWSVLQVGVRVSATGKPSADKTMLDARLVQILDADEATSLEQPLLTSDLSDPYFVNIDGAKWVAGHEIIVGPGEVGAPQPANPLANPVAAPDGSFSVPLAYDPGWPTGPEYELIGYDPLTQQRARADWIVVPPPTKTPVPTLPRPTSPVEVSPSPDEPSEGTSEPDELATYTPFPTTSAPPGGPGDPGGGMGCTPDEFENNWPRGWEKEIYVSFSESAVTQSHNFCGTNGDRGLDVDLAFFDVKQGRWYKVFTTNLAPGVDTVMAVGDLPDNTPCQPAGCWNDDRAALTYESEIVFQAVAMGRGMITVDNRGTNYSTDATYELGVIEYIPTPTPTHSPAPSPTSSVTPTPTITPFPLRDRCEDNDTCRQAGPSGCVLAPGQPPFPGTTIYPGSDEDWFQTVELEPGEYTLRMQPPSGEDYDLELREIVRESTSDCPLVDPSIKQGWTPGDATEIITWMQLERAKWVVRVYTPYPSVYGDAYRPFRLTLEKVGEAPTVTVSVTPTASATWTPAASPSASATASVSATTTVSATGTVTATMDATISPPGPGTASATVSATATESPSETPAATNAPPPSETPTAEASQTPAVHGAIPGRDSLSGPSRLRYR